MFSAYCSQYWLNSVGIFLVVQHVRQHGKTWQIMAKYGKNMAKIDQATTNHHRHRHWLLQNASTHQSIETYQIDIQFRYDISNAGQKSIKKGTTASGYRLKNEISLLLSG